MIQQGFQGDQQNPPIDVFAKSKKWIGNPSPEVSKWVSRETEVPWMAEVSWRIDCMGYAGTCLEVARTSDLERDDVASTSKIQEVVCHSQEYFKSCTYFSTHQCVF